MEYASEEALNALKAYPASEQGQLRWVLWLEARRNKLEEVDLLMQVRVGLEVETDGLNCYGLVGQLVQQSIPGWGYTFYQYQGQLVVTNTRMGGMGLGTEDAVVWAAPALIPYNSRLPVVIYTPEEMLVTHRIFKKISDYQAVLPG